MKSKSAASRFRQSGPEPAQRIRQRLDSDFHLSLMALFVVLATLVLAPFAVYRMVEGNLLAFLGNSATVLVLLVAFGYAWVSGRTEGARHLIVVFMALACVFMVVVPGHLPYWTFPTVVANFMLVRWPFALVVNAGMVLAVALGAPFFDRLADVLTFVSAVTMVGLFSMIFVLNTNFHRDRLNELAARDALTGALNRRVLRDDLTEAIRQSIRVGQPAAVALLDLDNFKRINDTQGHEIGDQVLIELNRIVTDQSRRSDRFYRLGGEEFVLLLENTDRSGAETALAKLMALIRAGLKTPEGPVTVSIGVAVLQPEESWSDWLSRADQAMYRAKGEGKDRVVFADS